MTCSPRRSVDRRRGRSRPRRCVSGPGRAEQHRRPHREAGAGAATRPRRPWSACRRSCRRRRRGSCRGPGWSAVLMAAAPEAAFVVGRGRRVRVRRRRLSSEPQAASADDRDQRHDHRKQGSARHLHGLILTRVRRDYGPRGTGRLDLAAPAESEAEWSGIRGRPASVQSVRNCEPSLFRTIAPLLRALWSVSILVACVPRCSSKCAGP